MNPKPHLRIALVLLWRDGQVLVTQRGAKADHLPDVWEFPGGKCEGEEAPAECAIREAREELGIEARVTGAREALYFEYPEREVTLYPFDCELVGGEPQARQSAGMRWLAPRDLAPEEFPPANRPLLEELKRRQDDGMVS